MMKNSYSFPEDIIIFLLQRGSECLELLWISCRVDNQIQEIVLLELSNNSTHLNSFTSYYMDELQGSYFLAIWVFNEKGIQNCSNESLKKLFLPIVYTSLCET